MISYLSSNQPRPNFLQCCYSRSDQSEPESVLAFVVDRIPPAILERMEFKLNGRRWPVEIPSAKFLTMYQRKGAQDLDGVTAYDFSDESLGRFRGWVTWSRELGKVSMLGFDELWGTAGVQQYLRDLLCIGPVYYGASTSFPFVGVQAGMEGLRQVEFPIVNRRDQLWYMLSRYFEAGKRFRIRDVIAGKKYDELSRLRMIYTYNVLSHVHWSAMAPTEKCTLREWVEGTPHRGVWEVVSDENCLWYVAPELREKVVRGLWNTGLFPTSEHFEILAWDPDANLPCLAARPSAIEFLVDPDKDRLILVK